MAIAIGSKVARLFAASPMPEGVCVGAGAVAGFEVSYADGQKDANATAAGLLECVASGPATGDPLALSIVTSSLAPGQPPGPQANPVEYIATGNAFTIGGARVWECNKLPAGSPGSAGSYLLLASVSQVAGPTRP